MQSNEESKGGIYSLGGFAYQIKVFVLYLLSLKEDMHVCFEKIDDVSVRKISSDILKKNEDIFKTNIISGEGTDAIQVKKTSVNKETAFKVLLNWMLLDVSKTKVKNYILFTPSDYNNSDPLSNITVDDLYDFVQAANSSRSLAGKVKKKFKKEKANFEQRFNEVKSVYCFNACDDIDDKLDDVCNTIFRKAAVNSVIYYTRIKELLTNVTYNILECVNQNEGYEISFQQKECLIEDICSRIRNDVLIPEFTAFKRINPIRLSDLEIANSREYKQLLTCNLSPRQIENQLQFEVYYKNISFSYKELNKICRVKDIEETTYENFEMKKIQLQNDGKDTPFNRLYGTQERENSYAKNEQIRYGSAVYLTREGENEYQISWKDKENEGFGT